MPIKNEYPKNMDPESDLSQQFQNLKMQLSELNDKLGVIIKLGITCNEDFISIVNTPEVSKYLTKKFLSLEMAIKYFMKNSTSVDVAIKQFQSNVENFNKIFDDAHKIKDENLNKKVTI